MHGTDNWWSIWATPCWLGEVIRFFCIFAQEMLDWAWYFLHTTRCIEQIHFIILFANFIGHATGPRLDLVETEFLFVVARLTDVYVLVVREPARSALVESCHKHDETAVNNFTDLVVAILASLDNFMFEKVLLVPMHSLLRAVVPTCVDPSLPSSVLPHPIDLRHNWLGQVVGISDMNPVPYN